MLTPSLLLEASAEVRHAVTTAAAAITTTTAVTTAASTVATTAVATAVAAAVAAAVLCDAGSARAHASRGGSALTPPP